MISFPRLVACGSIFLTLSCGAGDDSGSKTASRSDTPGAGGGPLPGGNGQGGDVPGANGAPAGGLPFSQLRVGGVTVLGIAGEDVVYIHDDQGIRTLEAVPLAGGNIESIATLDEGDRAYVRGGVVAFYKEISGGLGTLGLWTRAGGLKPAVATQSAAGLVVGNADGTRVAFGVMGTSGANGPLSSELAVTSTSAPAATTSGAGVVNIGDARCRPDIEFVNGKLFAAFCTPTVATRARLVMVDAQGQVTTLVTNPNNGGIQPYFSADATGSKLFVIGPVTASLAPSQGRIITVSPPSVATLENDVEDGFMLKDGSAAILIKEGGLKRATAVASPVTTTLVASGILGISDVSATRVIFHTQTPPDGSTDFLDLKTADFVTENQPGVTLVGTPTASPLGFAPGEDDVLYLDDFTDTGVKLNAVAAAGGAPRTLANDVLGAIPGGTSRGVVVVTGAIEATEGVALDLGYVPLAGGAVEPVAGGVVEDSIRYADKRIVYARLPSLGGGLYVTTLP